MMHQKTKHDDGLDMSCNDDKSHSGISLSEAPESEKILDRKDAGKQAAKIADKESRAVGKLRLVVFLALLLASVVVCVIIYTLTRKSEMNEFEVQFRGAGERVTKTFDSIATEKWGALGALRVAAMAEAIDKESPWPFVTLSSFERRAATAKRLSNSLDIVIEPIVSVDNKEKWLEYVKVQAPKWMSESLSYSNRTGLQAFGGFSASLQTYPTISHYVPENFTMVPEAAPGPWAVYWQSSPMKTFMVNNNLFTLLKYGKDGKIAYRTGTAVIGDLTTPPAGGISKTPTESGYYAALLSMQVQRNVYYEGDPLSTVFFPLFGSFEPDDNKTVAIMFTLFYWRSYFRDILPAEEKDVEFILENPCSGPFTYIIRGNNVIYRGKGDLHDTKFDHLEMRTSFENLRTVQDGTEDGIPFAASYCPMSIRVYPTDVYYSQFRKQTPVLMTLAVAVVFIFTVLMFFLYDRIVEHRQKLVLKNALQSRAIVTSLFPENVADRLIMEQKNGVDDVNMSNNKRLKSWLNEGSDKNKDGSDQPIADLFPQATVLFTDIAGFTAWSSSREPTQVFMLLQTLYKAFDDISDRRHVFKVETIGDSYMAVTGLPEPQEQHAVIMARFASEIRQKMREVTHDLSSILGPGTSDLTLRIGINSGPVTAGVLRGNRARFQLFGDTVNTASRMESTGVPDRIQISATTAEILIKSGKGHWVKPRADKVQAKGKGFLDTFWLDVTAGKSQTASTASDAVSSEDTSQAETLSYTLPAKETDNAKEEMMIDWVCEILQNQLKKVLCMQHNEIALSETRGSMANTSEIERIPLDSVVEFLVLPEFDEIKQEKLPDPSSITINERVISELRQFVIVVAGLYRRNPFHNFEHACHVVMSVSKLLVRVVSPDLDLPSEEATEQNWKHQVHDYTYGITSDPIANLAILISALVHDVDHRGVSNVQLIQEEPSMGLKYRNKSVAEQNSLEIAWRLFMSEQFGTLRQCMFRTKRDQDRFYQVLVNVVLATDIFDKELNDLRKRRWDEAFVCVEGHMTIEQRRMKKNLRATIVFEHLIQASDVAHTMQHWHVYRKWNKCLFHEQLLAYQDGRSLTDPCDYWYEGELSFFDNYIIPLARKLKECNVFGVYGDEYLDYAERNRAEWVTTGRDILTEMKEEFMTSTSQLY